MDNEVVTYDYGAQREQALGRGIVCFDGVMLIPEIYVIITLNNSISEPTYRSVKEWFSTEDGIIHSLPFSADWGRQKTVVVNSPWKHYSIDEFTQLLGFSDTMDIVKGVA